MSGASRLSAIVETGSAWPADSVDRLQRASDIWPGGGGRDLAAQLRRAIKSRSSRSIRLELVEGRPPLDCLIVPQGRDAALVIIRDLSAETAELERLRSLLFEDETTGLPNRQAFDRDLQEVLGIQGLREGRAAVLCVHLGRIDNGAPGLSAFESQRVLQIIAENLSVQVRGTNDGLDGDIDRVTIVARTDYRQLSLVLPDIETGEDAESVAARVVTALTEPVRLEERAVLITPSVGVALFPQDGADADTLFDNARMAMELARADASPSYRMHSGTMKLRALQRQDLASELRSALERDEFSLNYQPIVDASSFRPVALEALLRWPSALVTGRSVDRVLSIAERTGLIVEVGNWVMREALAVLAAARSAGSRARVSINLSPQEFSRADLAERICALCAEVDLPASVLELEINEATLARDAADGFRSIRSLRATGATVMLDDFGAGSSSLASLARSPIDGLKIDRLLVRDVTSDDRTAAACAAAVAIGRQLGLRVIAVGVETREQAAALAAMGCDQLQGFLFSRPMDSATVLDLGPTGMSQLFGNG